jgi:hypothetical protein
LGDRLSRGWGRRHTGCSTPQILTRPRDFYSTAEGDQKNCAVVAAFRRPFRFNNMNRHEQQTPEKPKPINISSEKERFR